MASQDVVRQGVEDTLAEIKQRVQFVANELANVSREIEYLKGARHLNGERLTTAIDHMQIRVNNLGLAIKNLTEPSIFSSYKMVHPNLIDTHPLNLYEGLAETLTEISDSVEKQCEVLASTLAKMTKERDPIQCLSDYAELLKEIRNEIVTRRERIASLKLRRKNADKGSNEQRNAGLILERVKSVLAPLEEFSVFVLRSFFRKRKKIMAEIWRTTTVVESLYGETTKEFKETIPSESAESPISSALRELTQISRRHEETHKANALVKSGQMTALERRKILAGLKN